jgi:hypothetical protein
VRAGKNLALLQAEASACVLELANVPNVGWPTILFFSCSKIFIIVVRFFGLLVTVGNKKRRAFRSSDLSGCQAVY